MHLSSYQINRYRYAQLTPAELLDVDDHLVTCEFCRQQLCSGFNVPAALSQLRASLQPLAGAEHLLPEQYTAYLYNQLGAAERELTASHLQECTSCTAQMEFLRAGSMAMKPTRAELFARLWAFLQERAALIWPMPLAALFVVVGITLIDHLYFRPRAKTPAPEITPSPATMSTPTPSPLPRHRRTFRLKP